MYLLGIIGVVIAGISLWYQRKSYLEEKNDDPPDLKKNPVESTGKNFVHTPSDLRSAPVPEKKKEEHKGIDPWDWQRSHQQTEVLPNPGVFDFD